MNRGDFVCGGGEGGGGGGGKAELKKFQNGLLRRCSKYVFYHNKLINSFHVRLDWRLHPRSLIIGSNICFTGRWAYNRRSF